MYNLKNGKGSFKGLIGECIFKLTDKDLIVTRFFNTNKWFANFGSYLTPEQAEFIRYYWFSIDAIKINSKNGKKVILYEVKTRNKYKNPKYLWRAKFTQSTVRIYKEELKLGFKVTVATVWLLDDWNYEVKFEDFEKANYCIDKPKKYDRAG